MARYLTLLTFTEQGLQEVKESSQRAAEFRSAVEAAGGTVISQDWSVGEFDGCILFEVPNEETASSLLLALGHAGNVRTRTMRLFNDSEFASMVTRI